MGVPALFRWLSKKYPKIILPVVEEEEVKVTNDDGTEISIPINIAHPNPNEVEFDNLYLDMNGIVHPCTHPEGKPAPETEEEMMVEIFSYTERVVNMIRPRKLLFMAIDGVAPRAKMNQQRSRRFRSSREAKEREVERQESLAIWEGMGKTVSAEEKAKIAWDSNAITPGTPFMTLLAASLRYWVASKLNTDPGWKQVQVIISDASVPGEGEHKIMDFIRRQRTNEGHDPNTRHVIYGLDADLIMLSLATHEPHFRVLREDVFAQDTRNLCRKCGQEGHYAAQCTGEAAEVAKPPPEKKPFIFLDVAILREYLEAELKVPQLPFPFNLEQAIDDWVLLIFFVGNDFLPHLPSLEIREGAIDTLLKIWKDELPRMGGYLTNHGQLELSRTQIMLEGLAKREDEIFRRRREAEERQDQNAKRRKIEREHLANGHFGPAASLGLTEPPRIAGTFAANADSIGLGGAKDAETARNAPLAAQALAGSNHDVVANRRAIRLANMSAAEVLKAELAGLAPVKKSASSCTSTPTPAIPAQNLEQTNIVPAPAVEPPTNVDDPDISGLGNTMNVDAQAQRLPIKTAEKSTLVDSSETLAVQLSPQGVKRKHEEVTQEDAAIDVEDTIELQADIDDDDDAPADANKAVSYALKVNADGTVDQEDTVKFWEPGYRDRYYSQKFGIGPADHEFRKQITTKYVEGMAWVLSYYYQGTPSWQWYYPYHFAPFAKDFEDLPPLQLTFDIGEPFKPFEQLMGVFPAASRQHIPAVFHDLMTSTESPIIDFYPETFEIDMNGKRMAWQGVALLPFIDETRLLDAMGPGYTNLTDEEKRRNRWGNDVLLAGEENPLYPSMEALYGKRKNDEPVPINVKASRGMSGSMLPNPECVPGSTYICPLAAVDLPDIKGDRSLSALYFFPKQVTPHRSVLLPGVRRPRPVLTEADRENARRSGRGRGRGGYQDSGRGGYGNGNGNRDYNGRNDWQRSQSGYDNSYQRENRSSYQQPPQQAQSYQYYQSYQSQHQPYQQTGYGGRGRGGSQDGYGYDRGGSRGSRGGPPRNNNNTHNNSYGSSYEDSRGVGQSFSGRGGSGRGRGGGYGGYGGGVGGHGGGYEGGQGPATYGGGQGYGRGQGYGGGGSSGVYGGHGDHQPQHYNSNTRGAYGNDSSRGGRGRGNRW
ncbi:XRN 5'-3' exonuclease N-terminus-domain-containing protein [Cytidiella melzeri]|nr:XRN 5'-3' exonuclease N-terminus-domain-containing protein [Cytidiella melzeri]